MELTTSPLPVSLIPVPPVCRSVQQLSDSLACQRAGAAAREVTVAPPYRPPVELSQSTVERVDAVLARLQQEPGDVSLMWVWVVLNK